MGKIRFRINFQTKRKENLVKFLDLYRNEISSELAALKIERALEFNDHFQATFFINTESSEKEFMVYELLVFANKLCSTGYLNWTFNGPSQENPVILECTLNNQNDDQSLKWAHLELHQND